MSNKRAKILPPVEVLRQEYNYDSVTGIFTHAYTDISKHKTKGCVAGSINKHGYLILCVLDERYKGHRVAWKMHYEEEPPLEIDHKNQIRHANWIENLREATTPQNCRNAKRSIANTSGFKGVSFHRATGKWRATIRHDYHLHSLGLFITPEQAHDAYVAAAKRFSGEFASAGLPIDEPPALMQESALAALAQHGFPSDAK